MRSNGKNTAPASITLPGQDRRLRLTHHRWHCPDSATEWAARSQPLVDTDLGGPAFGNTSHALCLNPDDTARVADWLRPGHPRRAAQVDYLGNTGSELHDDLDEDGWQRLGDHLAVRAVLPQEEAPADDGPLLHLQVAFGAIDGCTHVNHWIRSQVSLRPDQVHQWRDWLRACQPAAPATFAPQDLAALRAPGRDTAAARFDHCHNTDWPEAGDTVPEPGQGVFHILAGTIDTDLTGQHPGPRLAPWLVGSVPTAAVAYAWPDRWAIIGRSHHSSRDAFPALAQRALAELPGTARATWHRGLADTTALRLLAVPATGTPLQQLGTAAELLGLLQGPLHPARLGHLTGHGCLFPDVAHIHCDTLSEELVFLPQDRLWTAP